jgi:hypothetical protein
MDEVQKMALVPFDMIRSTLGENRDSARLNTLLRPPSMQKVLNLDRRMNETLTDKNMAEDERTSRYSQLLHELQHFKGKSLEREPLPVRITAGDKTGVPPYTGVLEREIIDTVPNSMVHKTRQLLEKIIQLPDLEWIERTGAVSVVGAIIEDSNLLDLVHDAIRPRKTFQ